MSSVKKFGNSDIAEPKRNIFISVLINTYIQAIICECFVSNVPPAWAFWFRWWALWSFSDTGLYDDLLKQLLMINSRRWNTFLSENIYIMGDICQSVGGLVVLCVLIIVVYFHTITANFYQTYTLFTVLNSLDSNPTTSTFSPNSQFFFQNINIVWDICQSCF